MLIDRKSTLAGHRYFPMTDRGRMHASSLERPASFAIVPVYRYRLPKALVRRGRVSNPVLGGTVLIDFLLIVFIWVDLRGLRVTVDDTLASLERTDSREIALRAGFFWLSLALVCVWSFYFAREWPIVPF